MTVQASHRGRWSADAGPEDVTGDDLPDTGGSGHGGRGEVGQQPPRSTRTCARVLRAELTRNEGRHKDDVAVVAIPIG